VAGERTVKVILRDILITELSHLGDPDEIFNEMWQKKKGLPCFIKLENAGYNDFLLTASYYDSIKAKKEQSKICKIRNYIFSFPSPLLERRIKYEYFPLQEKSSWLYIKSPNNFNVIYNSKGSSPDKGINYHIDSANSNKEEPDPGKLSLTIINSKSINTEKDTVTFSFDIVVPKSLKAWFLGIYYISIGALLMIGFNFLNSIYLIKCKPRYYFDPIGQLFLNKDIRGLILTIIAAIIATRGWLISEETIFRKYSLRITYIMIAIILLYIAGMIL
jgi:hypothetical protein